MNFTLTPGAARFIRLMLMSDGGPESGFRLVVSPGGCSGLSADISVLAFPEPGDAVVDRDGVRLFVPSESQALLEGVTVDFTDTVSKTGLVFHDPKASSTCGSHVH